VHIVVVGVSHRTAPLAVRERFALDRTGRDRIVGRLAQLGGTEGAVLATCGRVELYAAAEDPGPAREALVGLLVGADGASPEAWQEHLEHRTGLSAVRHLFRVAAGLDALVLGESEILGQVAEAHEHALAAGAARAVIGRLFRAGIRAGRRARTETRIGAAAASVPSVAVTAAETALGGLVGRSVLVLGAGLTGEQAVRALTSRGAGPVVVANRSAVRASAIAATWGTRTAPLERLGELLRDADVVVASTSAPAPVVREADVRRAVAAREGRPLLLMDLGVPRNVEPAARALPGVFYFDLDDLSAISERNRNGRRAEIPRVEAIVEEEVARFGDWLRTASVVPTIAELRQRAEAIRAAEVERALARMPDLAARHRETLEAMSRSLVKKLLHHPTTALKAEAGNGQVSSLAAALRRLFALGGAAGASPGA
jgi:glutamyl-tRNA reductase